MALDEATFAEEIEAAIEGRLGRILQVDARHCIPLRQRHARRYAQPGLVLIGDAAHSIHPLAGQGVNLGLLDAAELAADRKSTRLNSSHVRISYAVFCLKKKKKQT